MLVTDNAAGVWASLMTFLLAVSEFPLLAL